MSVKEQLLTILEENDGGFLSGTALAERLGVTRAGVWKCIQQLEAEGVLIESAMGRGYRLSAGNDTVTEYALRKALGPDTEYSFEVYDSVTSTNLVLKERAGELPAYRVAVASRQSAGRGRLGRSFYSPDGTGLYLSVLLRPKLPMEEAALITTAAAVAVCGAVEDCGGGSPAIKWVNDVYLRGKKICGILTEASTSVESGGMEYAVLGVGINVYEPEGGFPEEIRNVAGAAFTERRGGLRVELAASFLRRLRALYERLPERGFAEEYRRRSFLVGRSVTVHRPSGVREAVAVDVDGDCRLVVRYGDGSVEALSSGEVSVRPGEGEAIP